MLYKDIISYISDILWMCSGMTMRCGLCVGKRVDLGKIRERVEVAD